MADRLEDILQQRLAKLLRIRARGVDPYPHRFHRTHTNQEAIAIFEQGEKDGQPGPEVALAGRITALRSMGKAAFLDIRDGSAKIQVHLRRDTMGEETYQQLKDLDLGDFLGVKGSLFRTKTGEATVAASSFTILSKALQPLPEKWHGLRDVEIRYRQRYLDLVANQEVRDIFLTRSRVISSMRRFLDDRDFIEVETPVLHSVAGGAAARPFQTYHNALDRELHLRIATELHLKRVIMGGFDKVYEIGRIFRNEGISTRHNPEFTSLESYEAYADYNQVMAMVEELIASVALEVLGTDKITYGENSIDLSPPWRRMTLRDAIKEHSGIDFEAYPDADSLRQAARAAGADVAEGLGRGKMIDKLFATFVEPKLIQPTFLLDYPVELSPLAKRKPGSDTLVERFEGFAGGMEIANAFTELNDPIEQRERFRQQRALREAGDEEAEVADEDFLLALEHGMPPTGGLGIGIDRLVMLLTNQQSIREVILFPQLREK